MESILAKGVTDEKFEPELDTNIHLAHSDRRSQPPVIIVNFCIRDSHQSPFEPLK